ncbi:MAG TPA: isoprenylcysteine carboxylmethyltransferase family protein [Ktedonobacterales bacterium]|jgi:protein-S-isoprenylcysteine O-methyltransferase Ste14|nr:isoprenylcysteine carboxylmethyltransferase family protein [Ktedonobacterales bacterium]
MSQQSFTDTAKAGAIDSPGVKVPPPIIFALTLLATWGAQAALDLPRLPSTVALWVGIPVLIAGLSVAGLSIVTMLRGRGTLNTNAASHALVTSGIYRVTRNPMYLSLALQYTGAAIALDAPWALILLPLLLVYTQRMVIAREEAFLVNAFGQEYLTYKASVRRWL